MRTLIISGKDGLQQYPISDGEDFNLMVRAVELTVEAHNSVSAVEDRWVWGESGTETDPSIEVVGQ